MPGVARNGVDIAGGVAIEGSGNVNANGSGVVRLGDKVISHGVAPHSVNPPMIESSSTVYANGIGVCRSGDKANCLHPISGSSNVNAG